MLRYGVGMAISRRQLSVFAIGIALGALVVSGIWFWVNRLSPSAADNAKSIARPAPTVALAPKAVDPCPAELVAPVASGKDGKFVMQADLSGTAATDPAPFIVVGKEAAAAGRPRDAEVAFLTACRIAGKFKGADSVASADARYQLAWHYEWLAREGSLAAGANRVELLKRADRLYSDSLNTFVTAYGQAHEKSRFAADGLASVRQTSAPQAAPAAGKPAEALSTRSSGPVSPVGAGAAKTAQTSAPKPQVAEVAIARVAPPAAPEPRAAARPSPSFDCGKARSVPEKMICSDAELARLDRELGRLYSRAKDATSDPAAFRRRNNEEWRRRESACRDRECLLGWYAHRRGQLLGDIDDARQRKSPSMVSR